MTLKFVFQVIHGPGAEESYEDYCVRLYEVSPLAQDRFDSLLADPLAFPSEDSPRMQMWCVIDDFLIAKPKNDTHAQCHTLFFALVRFCLSY